ncbi:MAG: hypothetical protein HQK65_05805 [Desulfamplus sp.]|nr:hypothetical protein [Desulfamplus sp.]
MLSILVDLDIENDEDIWICPCCGETDYIEDEGYFQCEYCDYEEEEEEEEED